MQIVDTDQFRLHLPFYSKFAPNDDDEWGENVNKTSTKSHHAIQSNVQVDTHANITAIFFFALFFLGLHGLFWWIVCVVCVLRVSSFMFVCLFVFLVRVKGEASANQLIFLRWPMALELRRSIRQRSPPSARFLSFCSSLFRVSGPPSFAAMDIVSADVLASQNGPSPASRRPIGRRTAMTSCRANERCGIRLPPLRQTALGLAVRRATDVTADQWANRSDTSFRRRRKMVQYDSLK